MSTEPTTPKKKRPQKRRERRFYPQSAFNPWLVRGVGAVGATVLGAGAWAHFYGHAFEADEKLKAVPSYLVAAGSVLSGVAIWLGTSSDPPIRVGAPGVALERGELRRMPWWAVERVAWDSGSMSLVLTGADEAGAAWTFKVPVKAQPDAVAWIVREATDRIPGSVDIRDDVMDSLPRVNQSAGEVLELEPLQVVGRRCAESGKTISYEPDARVCTRCERTYFKDSVPKKCQCGASLSTLRGRGSSPDEGTEDEREPEGAET